MRLENVSGLSQQHAMLIDVAAKILADNLASLVCTAAAAQAGLGPSRHSNRSYAAGLTARIFAPVLLGIGDVLGCVRDALGLLARVYQRHLPGRSPTSPRSSCQASSSQCDKASCG